MASRRAAFRVNSRSVNLVSPPLMGDLSVNELRQFQIGVERGIRTLMKLPSTVFEFDYAQSAFVRRRSLESKIGQRSGLGPFLAPHKFNARSGTSVPVPLIAGRTMDRASLPSSAGDRGALCGERTGVQPFVLAKTHLAKRQPPRKAPVCNGQPVSPDRI